MDDRFDPSLDRQTGYKTYSVIAVPIRDEASRIVGVLQAINRQCAHDTVSDELTAPVHAGTYPFSDLDVSVLDILAGHAGSALKKAQLMHDMVRVDICTLQ